MKSLFLFAVINHHIEAAGHGDEKLVALFQRMARAVGAAGHVIKVEDPFDGERNMALAFDESQVSAWINDFRQIDDLALFQVHN